MPTAGLVLAGVLDIDLGDAAIVALICVTGLGCGSGFLFIFSAAREIGFRGHGSGLPIIPTHQVMLRTADPARTARLDSAS